MGKGYELVSTDPGEGDKNKENITMKIVDEKHEETFSRSGSEKNENNGEDNVKMNESEAILRNRFKSDENLDQLKTSSFEANENGWIERDPETTQTFKRKEQGLFWLKWSDSSQPDVISREEAWKLYIKKLQDESNYLLNTPDTAEICCCEDCIAEYELQCNEVLGWRRRAPTVEGFTKEVNTLCDPPTTSVIHTIVQEKYRAMPCSIM